MKKNYEAENFVIKIFLTKTFEKKKSRAKEFFFLKILNKKLKPRRNSTVDNI